MKTTILTLALALAFSFAAVPADAGLTEGQKCAFKANLLSGKLSLCLNKADANVSKGKAADTATADAKCESKFRSGWDKTREKAQDKDSSLGADCDGAMSDAVRDSVEASALIAVGRDLAAFAVSDADLLDDSGVQALIDDAVAAVDITSDNESLCTNAAGTYDSGADTCSVDITTDNAAIAAAAEQAGCEDAGGSWDSGTCTAASSYNCALAAFCSDHAARHPEQPFWTYANQYVGHTAASSGCDQSSWDAMQASYPIALDPFYRSVVGSGGVNHYLCQ